MAKTKTRTIYKTQKKKGMSTGETVLLVGGGLLGLYLLTTPGQASGGANGGTTNPLAPITNLFSQPGTPGTPGQPGQAGAPGQSILQQLTGGLTGGLAQTVSGVAAVPGEIVIGTPKKMITMSEQQTSEQVFGGQTRTNVPAFLATAPKGSVFQQPVTYQQFIQEQPIAFRAAAATGNIITGQQAAQYGAYVATETKKGQAVAGGPAAVTQFEQRYAAAPAWQQSLVAFGQALTVPFGGGGAAGWGKSLFG